MVSQPWTPGLVVPCQFIFSQTPRSLSTGCWRLSEPYPSLGVKPDAETIWEPPANNQEVCLRSRAQAKFTRPDMDLDLCEDLTKRIKLVSGQHMH